ncbi:Outer membrane lipoprotein Blc [Hydrogenovibrio crunogenus]|uniref:Outer membrane lipoprotein Blc n=1 Tax=Hydrogenovibrio crunogenus TaxID=39765 RepID=A0A4P7P1K9_9GAMM|nr:lipocalin family protein [Hydrogenovibrio crunogenus]QBZ84033.1 Outer membrane lipoprotein Blc [Hydrogenovibrio crunogenus]RUM92865.1 MAG: lipocalin [Thiomicrospira sp.]
MRLRYWLTRATALLGVFLLNGCTQVPEGVTPVSPFQLQSYLGRWYEVARLDHSFEKGLTEVTATYSRREDGGVKVINRGWNNEKNKWKEAIGKAYFLGSENVGSLKVSFFGPFYGGYHIAKLDSDYQMALIVGPSKDYAWILSRQKHPTQTQCDVYFKAAQQLGINQEQWIQVQPCR